MTKAPEMYLISVAADLLDMHPQTLRKYERLGLVRPLRTLGSMRVYTRDELDRLRLIKMLVDEEGINLAGVQRLLRIADAAQRLRPLLEEHSRAKRGTDVLRRLSEDIEAICELLGLNAGKD
jgi:MerR family transcriptional regulator, heat shock protein HspR